MRIVTWNCHHGECRGRAAALDLLKPDIAVLQECSAPAATDDQCVHFPTNPMKGVGVVAAEPWRLTALPLDPLVPDTAYPVCVSGPASFNILAIWSQRRPTYVRAILDALDRYGDLLRSAPSIVIGDFNSHSDWDRNSRTANHSILVDRLKDEFGLVSAFHALRDIDGRPEHPTFYWYHDKNRPFHIDYVFIPDAWLPHLRSVEIGGYDEWEGQSDHRPLVIELDGVPEGFG